MGSRAYFKFICFIARLAYPKAKMVFETEPDEAPGVFVCNHSAIRGPVMITLDFKRPHANWVINCSMDRTKCESYAFHDVFAGNSRKHKRFYRFLAQIVRSALPPILENVDTVPVYHDRRIIETFDQSVRKLESGKDIVVFGESPRPYSEYINELQRGFVGLGKYCWTHSGKKLKFYPTYVERKNRVIAVGTPIEYDPELPVKEQREIICNYLQEGVDRLARGLKKHKPVRFLEPRWYEAYGKYENDFETYWHMIENPEKYPEDNEP
ncbi:MAG: hypothetical protein IJM18_01825 [Clostridia bacterium]|nr:hypothetical protein [Clostridia bacterium]